MARTLSILAWGHRRATGPVAALARRAAAGLGIHLDVREQPLAGFEHATLAENAAAHDLVVFDHPFCGDAVASGCLVDLSELARSEGWHAGDYIGPSLESYRFGGGLWGVPVDAASQHAITRPDLMRRLDRPVPNDWDEAVLLGEAARARGLSLGIALASPHALMVLAALCANMGRPWRTDPAAPVDDDPDAMKAALDALKRLAAHCPQEAIGWNSIALHDAMARRDDIVFAPCVFGYATYGEADGGGAPGARRLGFSDFAGLAAPFAHGAVIGGAGLGICASCRDLDAARAIVRLAAGRDHQLHDIPARHGQPAHVAAWCDRHADERFNGFFSGVRDSLEGAWIRPRHAGYPAFQKAAGDLVTRHLAGEFGEGRLWDGLAHARDRLVASSRGPSGP